MLIIVMSYLVKLYYYIGQIYGYPETGRLACTLHRSFENCYKSQDELELFKQA